jgi:outer membrane immunogenic protein
MLSFRTIGAGALALTASAGMAFAADLPTYTPPPASQVYNPAPAFSWTGPYLGLTGGYGWGTSSGFKGGGYAGYNFQINPNWVVGVEGDILGSTQRTNSWDSSVRGRLGYAYDRYLFYGTGGVAFGDVKNGGASSTRTGWTLGAGVEAALTNNMTARVEYRYTDLGTANVGGSSISQTSNDLTLGVGFKF